MGKTKDFVQNLGWKLEKELSIERTLQHPLGASMRETKRVTMKVDLARFCFAVFTPDGSHF